MTNLAKLDFVTLELPYLGSGYQDHLKAGNLGETIREENSAPFQDQAKAMIFICRHLDEGLKSEYLTVKDPLALLKALRHKYNHKKTVILPRARYELPHLRIKDFRLVAEHNSAMFIISSQMKLYRETITEERYAGKDFQHLSCLQCVPAAAV